MAEHDALAFRRGSQSQRVAVTVDALNKWEVKEQDFGINEVPQDLWSELPQPWRPLPGYWAGRFIFPARAICSREELAEFIAEELKSEGRMLGYFADTHSKATVFGRIDYEEAIEALRVRCRVVLSNALLYLPALGLGPAPISPDDPEEPRELMRRLLAWLQSKTATEQADETQPVAADRSPSLIDLQTLSILLHRTKRTLERYVKEMPEPASKPGEGMPTLWRYDEVRSWAEGKFKIQLPETRPGDPNAA